ncbi:acyl-CoA synthetase FdrA [Chloroflexota bacterium]
MIVKALVKPNSYYDSLVLMRISTQVLGLQGVVDATVMMGTEQNKHSIGNASLLIPEIRDTGPNDLFFVVAAESEVEAQSALDFAEQALVMGRGPQAVPGAVRFGTLDAALRQQPGSNLAIISIPGNYVKREALKALTAGLNLLIFSDNVPMEDEIELKSVAQERGLLVMGPDCGTAIIGGAALAFANAVRPGAIGLVGAAGTGIQEVSCLIDHLGQGVSQAIGTGTHDVAEAVGGITMIQGLRRLDADPNTEVLTIVSKPPDPVVVEKVMAVVKTCRKPVVVNFLGGDPAIIAAGGGIVARTLEDTAVTAVSILSGQTEEAVREDLSVEASDLTAQAETAQASLVPTQKYVRGLFSGGTFCNEATMILADLVDAVYTNGSIKNAAQLADARQSIAHTCVDLGEDIFTVGKPHPMLEPSLRRERILQEAADPQTAVILLDIPIGYGVHPNPGGLLAQYIAEAKEVARSEGRELPVVASVCGVDADPQDRATQMNQVREVGAMVMPSNARATYLAAQIVSGRSER